MLTSLRFALAAPLALALGACGDKAAESGEIQGEAIAAIPAPAGTEWSDKVTLTSYDGYMIGNPDAPIKLVEYGSLTCPTCARFAVEATEPLTGEYVDSGVVSFELRNFPVHGTVDIVLARLTRCGPPEAVHPLSEQVWRNYDAIIGPVQANAAGIEQAMQLPMDQRFVAFAEQAGFLDFFAQRGISEDQARQCLADIPAMEKLAETAQAQATEFELQGTPTFMVNGNKVDANSWAQLEPILQRAGAR